MTREQAKRIIRRVNQRDGEGAATLYENYSGRGMFGQTTCGVVLSSYAVTELDKKKFRRDSMGKDVILY